MTMNSDDDTSFVPTITSTSTTTTTATVNLGMSTIIRPMTQTNKLSSSNINKTSTSSLWTNRKRRYLYYSAIGIALIVIVVRMILLDAWEFVDLLDIAPEGGMNASIAADNIVWKTNITTMSNNTRRNDTIATTDTDTGTGMNDGTQEGKNKKDINNKTTNTKTTTTTITKKEKKKEKKKKEKINNSNNISNNTNINGHNNHTSPNPNSPTTTITILVELSGEFGNNLQKIIRGWGVAKLAYDEFQIQSHIVYRQQTGGKNGTLGKAKSSTKMIQQCIMKPNMAKVNFLLGNQLVYGKEKYFNELTTKIGSTKFSDASGKVYPTFTVSEEGQNISNIRQNIQQLYTYLQQNPNELLPNQTKQPTLFENENYNATEWTASSSPLSSIPKAMIKVAGLNVTAIVNHYYDSMKETFVFNEVKCCGGDDNRPDDDESVLHYRNFATEMKLQRRISQGFEELDPKKIAYELFGHLNEGDKIAIAGRNIHKESLLNTTEIYKIVHYLKERNLTVRFPSDTNGAVEDFCFLKRTKKELVGTYKSTFVIMASYFGGATVTKTRLYQYSTKQSQQSSGGLTQPKQIHENCTHPELLDRIQFEIYY